jgi:hypothetical protein
MGSFDMFEAMANKMMSDFGNFGNFGTMGRMEPMGGRGFPQGSMMSRLDADDGFGSFGGVFGSDFMNMD